MMCVVAAIAEDGIVIRIIATRLGTGRFAAENAAERVVLPDDAGKLRQRIGFARWRAPGILAATATRTRAGAVSAATLWCALLQLPLDLVEVDRQTSLRRIAHVRPGPSSLAGGVPPSPSPTVPTVRGGEGASSGR